MGARDRVGEATNNHHEQRQQQHLDSGTPVPKATNAPVHPHHIELRPSNSLSALRPLKPKMSMTAPEREQPIRVDTGGHGGHITEAVPSKQEPKIIDTSVGNAMGSRTADMGFPSPVEACPRTVGNRRQSTRERKASYWARDRMKGRLPSSVQQEQNKAQGGAERNRGHISGMDNMPTDRNLLIGLIPASDPMNNIANDQSQLSQSNSRHIVDDARIMTGQVVGGSSSPGTYNVEVTYTDPQLFETAAGMHPFNEQGVYPEDVLDCTNCFRQSTSNGCLSSVIEKLCATCNFWNPSNWGAQPNHMGSQRPLQDSATNQSPVVIDSQGLDLSSTAPSQLPSPPGHQGESTTKTPDGTTDDTPPSINYSHVQTPSELLYFLSQRTAERKRKRRKPTDILRQHHCPQEGCGKGYGRKEHLQAHIRIKSHTGIPHEPVSGTTMLPSVTPSQLSSPPRCGEITSRSPQSFSDELQASRIKPTINTADSAPVNNQEQSDDDHNAGADSQNSKSGATSSGSKNVNNSSLPVSQSRRGPKQSLDSSKRFYCAICSESFTIKPNLDRHVESLHTDNKPYLCHVCGRGFSRTDIRTQHVVRCTKSRTRIKG